MKYGRELLKDVEGYVPGEQPQGGTFIKLNTNENPYPPSPKVAEAFAKFDAEKLRLYPDPVQTKFRSLCAERYGYPDLDWVVVGNGMDELLALVIRSFVDPGDTVLATYPTYSLYETLCAIHGCDLNYVNLTEAFQLPEEFYTTPARICLLTRPNAPSGVSIPRGDVERLCREFDGIVVIDEAYVDFAEDDCMDFPQRFENAIVMRTFSKSFSLAGIRLGSAVARPEVIREFLKTKDSYNLNAISQAVGIAAMEDYDHMLASANKIRATRATLRKRLIELGFDVPQSQSNFLLARWDGTPSARKIFEILRDQNIFLRYFTYPGLENALRITVGTEEECEIFLTALRKILT